MSPTVLVVAIIVVVLVLAALGVAAIIGSKKGSLNTRLGVPSEESAGTVKITSSGPDFGTLMTEKVFKPLSAVLQPRGGGSGVRQRLLYAGIRRKGALEIFLGFKLMLMIVLPLFLGGAIYFMNKPDGMFARAKILQWALGGVALGMLLPNFYLGSKARKRQESITLTLPDALDLLVVCVEAGLGLDAAILKIGEEMRETAPDLAEELVLVNLEMKAGKPRQEALRNLGLRTGVEDCKQLAARIIQADRFGTSIAKSLRIHSGVLRTRRRQAAEEKAAKTTVKLLFPLVFFIFPCIFLVILGPAAVMISRAFLK
ncbi:MAG TPA: type II secretion system F family protein [Candidatus Brocadiia bacterium]|nr:type II secretion system F family protein [Candidatus Brocadiia bacterium]